MGIPLSSVGTLMGFRGQKMTAQCATTTITARI